MGTVDLSPSDLVHYHHVMRLTQYRYRAGTPSQAELDEFIGVADVRRQASRFA